MNDPTETFRQEAEELLDNIESIILDVEQAPGDAEHLNRLFRAMHTIKGSGAMFGFDNVAGFAHQVETVLDDLRTGNMAVSPALIDLILAARDHIKRLLDGASGGAVADEGKEIIRKLWSLQPGAEPLETADGFPTTDTDGDGPLPAYADDTGAKRFHIRFRPDPDIFKAGMDPRVILSELKALGECRFTARQDAVPTLDALEPETCYLQWEIDLTTEKDENAVRDVFVFVEDGSQIDIRREAVPQSAPPETFQGEISPNETSGNGISRDEPPESAVSPFPQAEDDDGMPPSGPTTKSGGSQGIGSIRVASDKLDRLTNLVGELVIHQARLSKLAKLAEEYEEGDYFTAEEALEDLLRELSGLSTPIEIVERLTTDLRECALTMRMLPIGTLFGKFRRLVRDLSSELGKRVQLITEGAETELDKTVIERLNDPLIHLIRNSIDHGIQTPAERRGQGKPDHGTVRLSAEHRGGNVVVTVEDDGKGIDVNAVRSRAVERGLISSDQKISAEDTYNLIFHPGFSTARSVTSVSGRGVGMDVVKREIEAIGGTVKIESSKGKYLRITLSLPLTLAIINGLLVDVGGYHFVLPLVHVVECARLDLSRSGKTYGQDVIVLRGDLIPLFRLRDIFDIEAPPPEEEHVAIVDVENLRLGLVLDRIVSDIQTVIKSLGKAYRSRQGISGATIMSDGSVALIIDVPELIRSLGWEGNDVPVGDTAHAECES